MVLKKGLRLGLSLLAGGILLWLFFRKLDLRQIAGHIREARPEWLALAVVAQLIHLTLRSLRWRVLLAPFKRGIGFANLFSTTCIGYFVTFILGGRLGEVLRPMLLGQREGISRTGALATCVLERLMDALSVAALLGVYLVFYFDPPAAGTGALDMKQVRQAGLVMGFGTLALFPVLWLVVRRRERITAWLESHPRTAGGLVPKLLHPFLTGFDSLTEGKGFALTCFHSIAIWLVITGSIWASLKAFGLSLGFADNLLMMALLTLGIAVPTPGGAGSYEYAGQLGLVNMFGVETNRAAATILVTHFFAIAPVMLIGALFLWRQGLSLQGLLSMERPS